MDKPIKQQPLTASNIIGQKELTKLKQVPLPSSFDLGLTRIYFTTARDGFSRIFVLVMQIFFLGLIFFNGIGIGQLIANLPGLPAAPAFQRVTLQVVAMLVTILFAFIILIMILPVFLSKTIKGINLTCLFFLVFGTIINFIVVGVSFIMFFYSESPYRIIVLILAIVGMILCWISILNW